MKKIIIFIIAIVIVVAGVLFFRTKSDNKYNYTIEEVSEFKYYVYKENEKCGVIDASGKIILDAKYTNVVIPKPSRDLFVCYTDENANVFNSKNEKLSDKYESVEPISLKSVASALSYEKNVLKYKKDGKFGLISFDGKTITKNIYDEIENLQPTEGKFLVKQKEKYGVIDLNGNKIVAVKYDSCISDEFYTQESGYKKSGVIVLNKADDGFKHGYYNYKGKKILDVKYNDIERVQLEDEKKVYLIAADNGKYGLYKNSKKILENEYQEIIYDENVNLLMLQKNKKYGVASLDGKILIDVNCDEIDAKGIYLYVTKEGSNKVYDSKASIIDINFNASLYNTENDDYKISTILNNDITYYGITDKNGKRLTEEKYRYIEYAYKNYFIAKDEEGNLGVINSNGKEVLEIKYSSIQKINDKNIIQAIDKDGVSEFYSESMEKVWVAEKPNISTQEDYTIISTEQNKVYLDNSGKVIKDTSSLKKESFPEEIGEYKKEQTTIKDIYYVKK